MIDEPGQMLQVAKAARNLREHQASLYNLITSGEYNGTEFATRTRKLLATLDVELAVWERVNQTPDS